MSMTPRAMRLIPPLMLLCFAAFIRVEAQQSLNRLDAARVVLGPFGPQFQQLIDLDGDASPDALGMRGIGPTTELRLYQNQGDGTFTPVFNHSIGWGGGFATSGTPLVVADFDGDGRGDDVALSNGLELRLYQGGSMALSPLPLITLPLGAHDLLAVDLDQNGSDDLVILFGGSIAITLNPLSATPTSASIAIGTFAADTELMAIRRTNGSISLVAGPNHVTYSSGVGLSPAPGWGIGITSGHAMSGDLDGDGDEDGVIFNANGHYQRFVQTGGNLVAEPLRAASRASQLVDLDGDGDLDAVYGGGAGLSAATVNDATSYFEFSENDGGGLFGPRKLMRGFGAVRLAGASDLDGDGDLDFLAGRCVYFGRGSSIFERPFAEQPPLGLSVPSPSSRDIDRDGDIDIIFTPNWTLRNDGSGNFRSIPLPLLGTTPAGVAQSPMTLGDWDGNGTTDAILFSGTTPYVSFNFGGGALAWYPIAVAFGSAASALASSGIPVDLDGDGDIDCVGAQTSGFSTNTITAIQSAGLTSFTAGPTISDELPIGVADIDGDGLMDIVTRGIPLSGLTARLRWYRQSPALIFSSSTTISSAVGEGRPLIRDLDGDGDLDIVAYQPATGHILFTNDGGGNFSQTVIAPAGGVIASTPSRYALLDLSGDGIDDILASPAPDASPCSVLVQGTPTGFVATSEIYALVPSQASDVDGDGDEDLLELEPASVYPNLVIDGPNTGSRRQYGSGTAGSGGLVPTLGATGPFREGGTSTLHLRNATGHATCYFAFSTLGAQLPDYPVTGLVSYLDPLAPTSFLWPAFPLNGLPGIPGMGSADLSFPIPVGIAGLEIHQQAFLLDPQGPSGISASEGLVIRYGL